eukprot:jgi/Picre1/32157/NNA_007503.t1
MAFNFGASSTTAPTFSFSSTPSSGQGLRHLQKPTAQQQPSGGGLFGSASSQPSSSAGGGGFSFSPQQPTTSPLFGGGQQQPSMFSSGTTSNALVPSLSTGGAQVSGTAQPPDDSAIREIQSIQESYVAAPGNSRFKFQYLFLNVVENPAARVKPGDVDELQWREAMRRAGGPENPQHLWPVPCHGFKGLLERKQAQNEAIKEHKERLESLQKSVAALANRHETVVRVQMDAIKARQQELSQQLLATLRHIDSMEGRFSRAVGEFSTWSVRASGFCGIAARVQAGGHYGPQTDAAIDETSLSQAFMILKDYSDAIGKMQDAIHRQARDVAVLQDCKSTGEQ